jgi:hypothetical protein
MVGICFVGRGHLQRSPVIAARLAFILIVSSDSSCFNPNHSGQSQCRELSRRSDNKRMACFSCRPTSFRAISRAMAQSASKAASARLRRMGITAAAVDWAARATICETCPMRVLRNGVSYCGTPFLRLIDRDPVIDGCGCPTRDKAKSPDEHCPVDRNFKLPVLGAGRCNCRWCASGALCSGSS